MRNTLFIQTALTALASTCACAAATPALIESPRPDSVGATNDSGKPNVILIMTDQQSYNAISAHADLYSGAYFSTPNIDRLATSGISFTRTYCANPVSVPSRFALFTGRYGAPYGVRENQSPTADETQVRAMLATNAMGGVFARSGYDTYYGGKVHLPFSGAQGNSKFAHPVGYGFQHCYTEDERDGLGLETARILDDKAASLKSGKQEKPFLLVASFLNPHDICLESSTNLSTEVRGQKEGKKDLIAQCVRQMRSRAAAIDSVTFYAHHAPALPANFGSTEAFPTMKRSPYRDFPDWYWRKYRWTYGQLVSLVDTHIGHILDALDRHPELKKNTLIVFTSDHGEMQGAHHTVTKNLPYEECQRVPLIFSGPGIRAGARDHSLVCNGTDLLPTLCQLAGITAPSTDGLSLASRIVGNDLSPLREVLYTEGDGFLNAITATHKYTLFDGRNSGEMLINLRTDEGEMKNIIDSNAAPAIPLRTLVQEYLKNTPTATKEKQKNRISNPEKRK